MSSGADQGAMSDEELTAAEKFSAPAKASLDNHVRMLEQKMKSAAGGVKEEISAMKDRALEIKKGLDAVLIVLKKCKEVTAIKDMLREVGEKVNRVEEAVEKCGVAEGPWLKGVEVLPADETAKALAECNAASSQADA